VSYQTFTRDSLNPPSEEIKRKFADNRRNNSHQRFGVRKGTFRRTDVCKGLEMATRPFINLPEKKRTMLALTLEEMKNCRWL
jgi:hypothetical protein